MALIWTWHYGTLAVQEVPDDDWLDEWIALDDSDDCAMDDVEVAGQRLSRDDVRKLPGYQAIRAEQDAEIDREYEGWQHRVKIQVRHPERDQWSVVEGVEPAAADEAIERWAAKVGQDRVKRWE